MALWRESDGEEPISLHGRPRRTMHQIFESFPNSPGTMILKFCFALQFHLYSLVYPEHARQNKKKSSLRHFEKCSGDASVTGEFRKFDVYSLYLCHFWFERSVHSERRHVSRRKKPSFQFSHDYVSECFSFWKGYSPQKNGGVPVLITEPSIFQPLTLVCKYWIIETIIFAHRKGRSFSRTNSNSLSHTAWDS
jgi:hypothetical protein